MIFAYEYLAIGAKELSDCIIHNKEEAFEVKFAVVWSELEWVLVVESTPWGSDSGQEKASGSDIPCHESGEHKQSVVLN